MEIRVKEAAKRLGLHPSRIRQLITEGKLPATRHGKRLLLVKESDLNLIQPASRYSTLNNQSSNKATDLIDVINKQNSKIENLEKEILKLKEKILYVEETYSFSQQQVNSFQNKEIVPQILSNNVEAINKQQSVSKQRLEWLKANQKQYAGKYLGFNRENLVSIGSTYREAKESAIKSGVLNPFVVHVPDPKVIYEISW